MAIYLSFALIFAGTCLSASQTFILSYRAQIKDAVVISESYQFSKAMSAIEAVKAEFLVLDTPDTNNTDTVLKLHKDEILAFLMAYGVHTRSHEKINNLKSSSLISLTLPPSYITVDFNDGYVTITRLITD